MRKYVIFCLLAIAVAIASPRPASALIGDVSVTNDTGKCAWMTIYAWNRDYAGGLAPRWEILHSNDRQKPGFLKPHESRKFDTYGFPEIKLRAEVKQNADCTGATIADTYDKRENFQRRPTMVDFHATIHDLGGGKYMLWF